MLFRHLNHFIASTLTLFVANINLRISTAMGCENRWYKHQTFQNNTHTTKENLNFKNAL